MLILSASAPMPICCHFQHQLNLKSATSEQQCSIFQKCKSLKSFRAEWCQSVVSRIDIVGVTSSNLVPPTIFCSLSRCGCPGIYFRPDVCPELSTVGHPGSVAMPVQSSIYPVLQARGWRMPAILQACFTYPYGNILKKRRRAVDWLSLWRLARKRKTNRASAAIWCSS